MSKVLSKTAISFYRRLYIAYLIETNTNTVPKIMKATGWERSTVIAAKKGLNDYGIETKHIGANKDGYLIVSDWGRFISKSSVIKEGSFLKSVFTE